jgi:hypothetical protein
MSEAFFMARDLAPDHPDVVSGRRFRSANQWPEDLPGFREPLFTELLSRADASVPAPVRDPLEPADNWAGTCSWSAETYRGTA